MHQLYIANKMESFSFKSGPCSCKANKRRLAYSDTVGISAQTIYDCILIVSIKVQVINISQFRVNFHCDTPYL